MAPTKKNTRRQANRKSDTKPDARDDIIGYYYEAVTRGVKISVAPSYLENRSSPEDDHYFWSYVIEIRNDSPDTIQLKSRTWRIVDANGQTQDVSGPGVIGQTPTIPPGESFTYSSGCPLRTPQGIMVGSYQMVDQAGLPFDVAIPAFSLDSPHATQLFN